MEKIKVLIVEDSKLMQDILSKILSSDADISVVGTATDALIARDLIKKLNPDVLTLDIMLPFMDGITFLKNLMRLHPLPVVMISSLTDTGSSIALEALSLGAVDYLPKPSKTELTDLSSYAKNLISVVKNAAKANVEKLFFPPSAKDKMDKIIYESSILNKEIIAIGASTGGVEAIESLLVGLPQVLPPILVVQHIKKEFGTAFSKRISKMYGLKVKMAENYRKILPAHIYIAPPDTHLVIRKRNGVYFSRLLDTPPVNGHKPSIDVLFKSVADIAGPDAIGILLTGMGVDGAKGLKALRDAGGSTIAQDRETSVVWGMPGTAVKLHAVDYVLSIDKIPQKILQIIDTKAMERKSV